MIDRRPHVIATTHNMFIVLAAIWHFGEGADPVDETSVRHAAIPDDASWT